MDMDQLMDAPPSAYSVGVPIPGRQQWQFSGPEFTEMRAGRAEPELATSAGGAGSFPPPTDYGSSPSPGAPWPVHADLARNLAGIQIDDFDLEDVDVADLISGPMREPTLTELNAGDDLGELSLDFAGDSFGAPATPLVKTELLDAPVKSEWAPFSSSIPASFAPQTGAPLVGQHDPMLPSFPTGGGGGGGTSGGRLTLQALLAQPAAAPRPSGAAGRLSSSVPCDSHLEQQRAAGRLGPLAAGARVDELRGSSSSVSTGEWGRRPALPLAAAPRTRPVAQAGGSALHGAHGPSWCQNRSGPVRVSDGQSSAVAWFSPMLVRRKLSVMTSVVCPLASLVRSADQMCTRIRTQQLMPSSVRSPEVFLVSWPPQKALAMIVVGWSPIALELLYVSRACTQIQLWHNSGHKLMF
ncbi:hypothetical protein FJT64_026682 [Amphibalanus amphitrite]|uniref:Uncharacterized protein n=1 Tax=Amphibalanus amphitrite TaxID=1232801 RepID=A0A6A4W117_AMPAM|nr:hypothetical protein FJT64_026682 [Amphibalanus amphitrite]